MSASVDVIDFRSYQPPLEPGQVRMDFDVSLLGDLAEYAAKDEVNRSAMISSYIQEGSQYERRRDHYVDSLTGVLETVCLAAQPEGTTPPNVLSAGLVIRGLTAVLLGEERLRYSAMEELYGAETNDHKDKGLYRHGPLNTYEKQMGDFPAGYYVDENPSESKSLSSGIYATLASKKFHILGSVLPLDIAVGHFIHQTVTTQADYERDLLRDVVITQRQTETNSRKHWYQLPRRNQ